MGTTKLVVMGSLFAALAFLLQITPVIFSEAFVLVTMCSALPIYFICWISPKYGIASVTVATTLIFSVSVHEGVFFLFTNAPLGVALGIVNHYTGRRLITVPIASLILALALSIINFFIGIPVFGTKLPGTYIQQFSIVFGFSLGYSFLYQIFAHSTLQFLERVYKFSHITQGRSQSTSHTLTTAFRVNKHK